MKGIPAKLLYTCKKATQLVEKQKDKKLSILEKVRLKLHLWICKACAIYAKQSQIIEKLLKKRNETQPSEKTLSEEAKIKILEKIRQ
jgi:hypothetical protein